MEILRERLLAERRRYSEKHMKPRYTRYVPISDRKPKNLSMRAASELMGLPTRALQQYETGRRLPSAKSLAQISRFYGCSVDYLLGLSNNRERSE